MNIPNPITPKQQETLKLLYAYRFLTRPQLQSLLNHKDKRRIISWVKDLRNKEYIDWKYNKKTFNTKNQPAIYYLSLKAIQHLRKLGEYPNEELRKRYKEPTRTQTFIDRCLLVADCCITLKSKSNNEICYSCVLPVDYIDPENSYYFLDELKPHLYFEKQIGDEATNYLLENLELTLPRYQLRKRIKDYVEYLDDWDVGHGPTPIALFICSTLADLIYIKRRVRLLLEDFSNDDLQIRVTTIEKIKEASVVSKIWEDV
jgi:hypothetical protein